MSCVPIVANEIIMQIEAWSFWVWPPVPCFSPPLATLIRLPLAPSAEVGNSKGKAWGNQAYVALRPRPQPAGQLGSVFKAVLNDVASPVEKEERIGTALYPKPSNTHSPTSTHTRVSVQEQGAGGGGLQPCAELE